MRIKCFISMLILVTFFSGAFFVPNSFADSKERDEIIKFIKQKKARWSARDTKISHFTSAERKKRLGSQIPTQITQEKILVTTSAAVPSQLDWRNYNGSSYVTPVKEQSDCSDCWAFASTAALESNKLIFNNTPGVLLDLSEQTLNSCSGAGSCSGGYIDAAANFLRDIGLPLESCNPYTATDGMCSVSCSDWLINPYKISGWYKVNPAIEAIKYALYNYGPVVALMSVYTDYYYYSTGVYEYSWGSFEGYHATLIVGYDDAEQCFIIKSSWGEDWGEAGYGKIAYSEVAGNSQFGFWTIAYENAIPTGFPTQDNIPRDPNNPNTTGQNGNSNTQLSILNGSIKDESGNVVSGAEIKIGNYKVTSNVAGIYVFSSLPAGSYVATISKSGYSTLSENLTITSNDKLTKDFIIYSSNNCNTDKNKKDKSTAQPQEGAYGPGWIFLEGKAVTSGQARVYLKSRREKMLAAGITKAPLAGAAADISSDIQVLARALHYDPKLIYDYVHNNIDYLPYYGSLKGATLTYLDGSGNDFDQASLMIALLRASGKTARYVFGQMTIPITDMAKWLGIDKAWEGSESTAIDNVLKKGLIPHDPIATDATSVTLYRIWVSMGTENYLFDPAFKKYDNKNPIDLSAAMGGYDRAALLSAAGGAQPPGADYTQNLNDSNLRNLLTTYTTALANTVRNQYPNSEVKDIVGGHTIIPENLTEYQTTLPFLPTNPTIFWTGDDIHDAPDALETTLQISICQMANESSSCNETISATYDTADLSGKRMTVSFNGNKPQFILNGGEETKTSSSTDSYAIEMTITVNHPYASIPSHSATYNLTTGGMYSIVYNFGGISDMLLQKRQKQLEFNRLQPEADDTSEAVLGETLNIIGQNWLKQVAMTSKMVNSIVKGIGIIHHNVGVVAQEPGQGYYIDVKLLMAGFAPGPEYDKFSITKTVALVASGLEHGILQQLTGGADVPAVSTIKLLQIANSSAATDKKVYLFKHSNYINYTSTAFKALFSNYKNDPNCPYNPSTCPCTNCVAMLGESLNADTDNSDTYILPSNGSLGFENTDFKFRGYIKTSLYQDGSQTISMGITHDSNGQTYDGGYYAEIGGVPCVVTVNSSSSISVLVFSPYAVDTILSTFGKYYSIDPVDMAGGSFVYNNTDLALGGNIPLGLAFSRSYNSNKNLSKQTLGYGFNHNYNIYLSPISHAEPVLGSRQPLDAAGMIVALYSCLDLMKSQGPLGADQNIMSWMVAALTANWGIDQLINNAIMVNMGNQATEYIKLADGTYIPPPGITTQLIKNNGDITIKDGDIFSLQERSGVKMNFNALAQNTDKISSGKISQIVDADGNTANFEYNITDSKNNKMLTKVTDAFGRYIKLIYDTSASVYKITSVSDYAPGASTPMRTVLYSYDTTYPYNLAGYTDAEGKIWSYGYATPANHLITSLVKPVTSSQNITTITNVYDDLDRVKEQKAPRKGDGATYDVTYEFYFSGYRNQEVDPEGHATTYYYDKKGRLYAQEDALGNKVTKTYDGQDHVIKVTSPRSKTADPIITTYEYENNNLAKVTNALNQSVRKIHETQYPFRLTDVKDDFDHGLHYNYDPDHPYSVSDITDSMTNIAYSTYYSASEFPKGFRKTAKDPKGTTTIFTYDSYGNPFTSKTAAHPIVKYTYDILGRMTDLYDQENPTNPTHFEYDKRGLLQSKTDLLGNTTTYTYYYDGLLLTKTDRNNQTQSPTTITYAYTPTGKTDTITYSDASQVKFYYNNLDQLIGMDDFVCAASSSCTGRSVPYVYDAAGRLRSMKDSNGNMIGYNYDEAGNLIEINYPPNDGTKKVIYTYDKLNRLETVRIEWLNQTALYSNYDDAGRLHTFTNFNGTVTTYDYDNANRLTSISNQGVNGTIASYNFVELDANGNRRRIEQTDPCALSLDASNVNTYGYNARKNRLTDINNVLNYYAYDNEGQLLTGNSGAISYTFDYEHRLKKIGTDTEFFYDGNGNRLRATRPDGQTRYIYDAAGRVLAEANSSNVITRYYIYGTGLLAVVTPTGQVYCYHFNGVGSTVAITDNTQAIVNQYSYDAFGNIANQMENTSLQNQPFTYVGESGVMKEPNGFYYMKARFYDPTVGRFISEDPIGFEGDDTNLMAYTGNNPVTRIDPSGLWNQPVHLSNAYVDNNLLTSCIFPWGWGFHFNVDRMEAKLGMLYATTQRQYDRYYHAWQDSWNPAHNGFMAPFKHLLLNVKKFWGVDVDSSEGPYSAQFQDMTKVGVPEFNKHVLPITLSPLGTKQY